MNEDEKLITESESKIDNSEAVSNGFFEIKFSNGKDYNLDELDRKCSECPLTIRVVKDNKNNNSSDLEKSINEDGDFSISEKQDKFKIKKSDIRKYRNSIN